MKIRYILICFFCFLGLIKDAYGQQSRRIADMLELPAPSNSFSYQQIFHLAYTVSFNPKHKIPNWVAWMLTKDKVINREFARSDNFVSDPQITDNKCPDGNSYSYSGYDRGHMCPAGDNTWSKEAMDESFYMSNMCPQAHELNNGTWKRLEERCRKWAVQFETIYIVCGPIIPEMHRKTIGDNITVPNHFFKAILRIDKKNSYRVLGFLFSQQNDCKVVTIDEIEQKANTNLFHRIPKHIQDKIESEIDYSHWPHYDR